MRALGLSGLSCAAGRQEKRDLALRRERDLWYLAHFPLQRRARAVERATGVAPLTFESSPYYMFHPLAAERTCRSMWSWGSRK